MNQHNSDKTKAKTAEEIIRSKKISLHNDDENGICYVEMRFIDCVSSIIEYSAPLQSHIANLEAEKADLESALTITTTSRNFQKARADNLEAQNKELREALEKIVETKSYRSHTNYKYDRSIGIAEKALKEDKQDG